MVNVMLLNWIYNGDKMHRFDMYSTVSLVNYSRKVVKKTWLQAMLNAYVHKIPYMFYIAFLPLLSLYNIYSGEKV